MDSEKQVNRFCFAIDKSQFTISNSQLAFTNKDNDLPGIEDVAAFEDDTFVFLLLDVHPQFDFTDLTKRLKNQNIKSQKGELIKNILFANTVKPLNRIFKMYPHKAYITKKIKDYKRFVMTLELNSDKTLIETYIEVHKAENIWPEIIHNMKTMGVKDMEIYLYGHQAFLIMETLPSFDLEQDGKIWENLPREKEWQAYVAKFQKVNPETNAMEKWIRMPVLI